MSTSITWPQIVTAIVAGMAFVLSIVALGFQWWSWRRGGARLAVSASSMKIVGPGLGREVISVEVTNTGRLAGQVASIWFMPTVADADGLFPTQGATVLGKFPTVVAAQTTETWVFDRAPIALQGLRLGYEALVPNAKLGTGEVVAGAPMRLRSISPVSPETQS